MARVGQECRRIGQEAVAGFDDHKRSVERNANRKGAAEADGRVDVTGMTVTKRMVMIVVAVIVVRVIASHTANLARRCVMSDIGIAERADETL